MKIRIQHLDHKQSGYERPNQKWVCGWAKQGKPCPNGPSGSGKCTLQSQGECHPYMDENKRYHCNRAIAFGGKCENGPLPDGKCCSPTPQHAECQPDLSLRAKRHRLVGLTLVLTITLLVIIFSSTERFNFANPGALSSAHSGLLNEKGQSDCSACHQAGDKSFSEWFSLATMTSDPHSSQEGLQYQCLSCHFKGDEQVKSLAKLIHNRSDILWNLPIKEGEENAELLETIIMASAVTAPLPPLALKMSSVLHGQPDAFNGGLNCIDCHQEHQGKDHDLNTMTDNQCQSCHQLQFNSFEDGHPEFSEHTPVETDIIFDHVKHKKSFVDNQLNCQQCHGPNLSQNNMQLLPFEQSCQGCHEQGSKDHHGDAIIKNAIIMFQLPTLEIEDETFDWPEGASTTTLPPLMSLLLAGDEELLPILEVLYQSEDEDGAEGDFEFWAEDIAEDEDKIRLANGIKRLVTELCSPSKSAKKALSLRLSSVIDLPQSHILIDNLSNLLLSARFTMQVYENIFLPNLANESQGKESLEDNENMDWLSSSGSTAWYLDKSETSVYYRPTIHADRLLLHWLNAINHYKHQKSTVDTPISQGILESHSDEIKVCSACHNASSEGINWVAGSAKPVLDGFEKFSHEFHVSDTTKNAECTSCHTLQSPAVNGHNSSFQSHDKQMCATCHTAEKVSNSCTTCHTYHMVTP